MRFAVRLSRWRTSKELAVKQLGFIAINGFVEQEKPYTYLDGNDIFAGM